MSSRALARLPALLAATLLGLTACSHLAACNHAAAPPAAPGPAVPQVIFTAGAGEIHVAVELARTLPEQERGLMFRQSLASGHGMLFLYDKPQKLIFWMKNTYIPLDMIFLDGQKRVVYIDENAEPLTLSPRGPDAPTQYVLEVPGGWSREHGIGPGVQARFDGVDQD